MTHTLTNKDIALGDLVDHPSNVRVISKDGYAPDEIADLQASIAVLGLIQPPLVQKIDGKYGVLAGGRRHAALLALAKDKTAKLYTLKTKVACRLVPEGCDVTTAMSLAENVNHKPMGPIDEFEAYARMMEVDGQTPESIAMTFGTTVASVKDRLRYGLIHPNIRDAARKKAITLDAMKAFAGHPSADVQKEVYDALIADGTYIQAYVVKNALNTRGVKISDDLGAFVLDGYKEQDGQIAADLLEEHSVLEDMALVQSVLMQRLKEEAEAKRAELGFSWADAIARLDHNLLGDYGRVYPEPVELDAKATKRIDAIEAELSDIYARMEDEEITDDEYRALNAQEEALSDEARSLQEAYTPEDLARSGVLASWNGREVSFTMGLIRPEDMEIDGGAGEAGSGGTDAADEAGTDDTITYSAALAADMKIERATALSAAIAQNPEATVDLVHFNLIKDVIGIRGTHALGITAQRNFDKHTKEEEIDQTSVDQLVEAQSGLDFSWDAPNTSPAEQFAKFRELHTVEKHKLVAFATALTTKGCFARNRNSDPLMHDFEIEIMPDIREHWTPNAAFFNRLKKAWLLNILNHDLGLAQEALKLASSSKKEIVAFMDKLFLEPFATLSEAQRSAVAAWCPPSMQTSGVSAPEALTAPDSGDHVQAAEDTALAA